VVGKTPPVATQQKATNGDNPLVAFCRTAVRIFAAIRRFLTLRVGAILRLWSAQVKIVG